MYPANYEKDDIYAGEYYLRRFGDSVVSIEMRNYYVDTLINKDENALSAFDSETSKMFVLATMYGKKKKAENLVRILKPKYKQTSIIVNKMFMGCMH